MQPISQFMMLILKVMRISTLIIAVLMVFFLALAIWQKAGVGGISVLTRQDYTFFGVLLVLAAAALWMWRAIGREMNKPGA